MQYLVCLVICGIVPIYYAQQPETLSGLFTIEQPGSEKCFTLDRAAPGMDDDRVVLSRCRENPDDSQQFTVDAILDEERTQFSLIASDSKCFFVDTLNELRRSDSLCDKNLNYFLAQSATSSNADSVSAGRRAIKIMHVPSNKCLTANLDATLNMADCEPGNARQNWRVCRSDDAESCLRFYEL
ncbi:uncharacterized protein LOC129597156 [Paramacrobiotus metropolitanus]|uniref:uncharacterized protein LOC129597156 n=1 Tax=Paramacrobiotus metropolitanus TaxID=2943436 RepID=UPI00244573EC|nr:uncharacterized protein LOC129597156 [Paramacrobiotus metropolitanus]